MAAPPDWPNTHYEHLPDGIIIQAAGHPYLPDDGLITLGFVTGTAKGPSSTHMLPRQAQEQPSAVIVTLALVNTAISQPTLVSKDSNEPQIKACAILADVLHLAVLGTVQSSWCSTDVLQSAKKT